MEVGLYVVGIPDTYSRYFRGNRLNRLDDKILYVLIHVFLHFGDKKSGDFFRITACNECMRYIQIFIPKSLNAVFKSQLLTPIALQASGIITRFRRCGLLFSYVTRTIFFAAAVATR